MVATRRRAATKATPQKHVDEEFNYDQAPPAAAAVPTTSATTTVQSEPVETSEEPDGKYIIDTLQCCLPAE